MTTLAIMSIHRAWPTLHAAGMTIAAASPAAHHSNGLLHLLLSFGLAGVFLVSIVDSSFVPLPIPGMTDIMIVVLAAQHANLFLLVGLATAGSFLGGLISYHVGQSGGITFLEKRVPPRIFRRVTSWMESHAILAVALPAILPPPMPLSPFVLAAGALKMSRSKFLIAFTVSRFVRHASAAGIGIYYGPHVLRMWNLFTRKYAVPILSTVWSIILLSVGFAFWKIYSTSRAVGAGTRSPHPAATPVAIQLPAEKSA